MAEDWWDTGGGFSLSGGDTSDIGSFSPSDYSLGGQGGGFDFSFGGTTGTPDILGSQGMYGGGADASGYTANPSAPYDPSQQAAMAPSGGMLGMLGLGGGGTPQGGGGPAGGLGLQGLLGLGGGLAGLIGTLAGGGRGPTTMPQMGTNQRAMLGQANQATQPGATGQLPLQQMQMSLLQALASGQGLPPGYAQLIEQAFQPQMGSLYEQATNAGRARGFYDAPATAPPGGAVLGPGLADLQGQMAQAKLGLMQSLPGLYNQPIQSQIGAAGQQGNTLLNAARMGTGQQTQQPMGPQIGQAIGAGLQGMGQAMRPPQPSYNINLSGNYP